MAVIGMVIRVVADASRQAMSNFWKQKYLEQSAVIPLLQTSLNSQEWRVVTI